MNHKFIFLTVFGFLGVLAATLHFVFGSIGAYVDWLSIWWPIIVAATLPHTLLQASGFALQWHFNRLDRKYQDVLDEHAGYWIKGRVAAAGLADEVEVGKTKEPFLRGLDAYWPLHHAILLGDKTYDRQHPTYWAVAAHELGHAIDFRARPLLLPLSIGSRATYRLFVFWANSVLLGNILFGWSVASDLWWFLLVGALVTGAVILVDEAVASRIGLKILAEDDRITAPMIRDIKRHLLLAFNAYFGTVFGVFLVFLGAEWLSAYVETHAVFVPAEPLYPGHTSLANTLSVAVLVIIWFRERERLARWWRRMRGEKEPYKSDDALEKAAAIGCVTYVVGFIVTAAFFLEVWNQPLGPWYRAAVFMYIPIVLKLAIPVTTPVTLIMNLPVLIARYFMPKVAAEAPVPRAQTAVADAVTYVQVVDPRQRLPWYMDAIPGILHFGLPLLILWWASQIWSPFFL